MLTNEQVSELTGIEEIELNRYPTIPLEEDGGIDAYRDYLSGLRQKYQDNSPALMWIDLCDGQSVLAQLVVAITSESRMVEEARNDKKIQSLYSQLTAHIIISYPEIEGRTANLLLKG